jgi:hypothetical protein
VTRFLAGAMAEQVTVGEKHWRFYDELAKQHHVTIADVMAEVLRQYADLDPKVRARALTPKRFDPAQHSATIIRLNAAGWSDNRIADHLGCGQPTISRYRANVLGLDSPTPRAPGSGRRRHHPL